MSEEGDKEVGKQQVKLIRNSSWMVVARGARAAEVVARSIVIARSLGVDLFAQYAVISAFVYPFVSLFTPNLFAVLIKYGTDYKERGRLMELVALVKLGYLASSILYVACSLCIVAGSLWLFPNTVGQPGQHFLVILFGIASAAALYGTLGKSLLVLFDRFKVNTFVDLIIASTNVVLVVVVCLLFPGNLGAVVWVVAGTMLYSPLVSNIAAWWEVRYELSGGAEGRIALLRPNFRELFKFSFGDSIARSIENATKSLDVLILSAFAGPAAVSIYDIARKLANIFFLMKDTITLAAFPQVASMIGAKQYKTLRGVLASVYKKLLVPALVVLVLIVVFDDWVLSLWGSSFAEPGGIVVLTMSRSLVPLLCFWVTPLVLSLGLIRLRLMSVIISSTISFSLAFFLVTRWEGEGVAAAMLIGALLNHAIMIGFSLRRINCEELLEPAEVV